MSWVEPVMLLPPVCLLILSVARRSHQRVVIEVPNEPAVITREMKQALSAPGFSPAAFTTNPNESGGMKEKRHGDTLYHRRHEQRADSGVVLKSAAMNNTEPQKT